MRPLCVHHTSDRGPLDSDMKVNPLAMRYDGTEDDPRDPRDLRFLHGCPNHDKRVRDSSLLMKTLYAGPEHSWRRRRKREPVTVVYSPLVEGQGLLFWTRWTMHTALPIMDVDISKKSENCRTSFEFRFWFIGENPVQDGTPQRSLVLLEQQEEPAGTGASDGHKAHKTGDGGGHKQTAVAPQHDHTGGKQKTALTPERIKTLVSKFRRFLRDGDEARAQDAVTGHGTEVDDADLAPCPLPIRTPPPPIMPTLTPVQAKPSKR